MPEFFWKQYEMTFRWLHKGQFSPNLAVGCESWLKRRFWTEIYEKFPLRGHLLPKPQTLRGSNRYLTQSKLQVKGCTAERYCLFHVVVQGPGSFWVRSTFPYDVCLRSYGASNLHIFFGLFSPYKTPKTYLPVISLQTRGYIAEWFRFFHVVVEDRKGCLPAAEFFCNFW